MNHKLPNCYIGIMSGTSLDAIDAALVNFDGPTPRLICKLTYSIPENLRKQIIKLCSPSTNELQVYGETDRALGHIIANTVLAIMKQTKISAEQIIAIGSHGQTIRHMPMGKMPFTLQIGDPNIIAEYTGINTVADFRRRDIAAGGQGAPLAPAFHAKFLSSKNNDRAILNLGGIANLTLMPSRSNKPVTGFDTGPANLLIDYCYQQYQHGKFDDQGKWAASGIIDKKLLQLMLQEPYFQQAAPKSTGRELFNPHWLKSKLEAYDKEIIPKNLCATLVEMVAVSVSDALKIQLPQCKELIICGGGVHNYYLLDRLGKHLPLCRILSTAEFGIDPDYLESIAFAWFASLTMQGKPSNLPLVTGAKHEVILGGVYYA